MDDVLRIRTRCYRMQGADESMGALIIVHKRIKQLPTLIYALWLVKTSDMTCSGQSVCLISVLRNYIILKFLMTLTPSRLFYFFYSCLFLQKAIT